jgi:hypothetical protein
MTIEAKTIADYPAYRIVEPAPRKEWQADETFAMPIQTRSHGTLWHFYKLGSVVSYALRTNSCPIAAIDRARANKHEMHFAFALSTVLTAWERPKETVIGLGWGDHIKFQGHTFQLVKAPNDNVRLVEVAQ